MTLCIWQLPSYAKGMSDTELRRIDERTLDERAVCSFRAATINHHGRPYATE